MNATAPTALSAIERLDHLAINVTDITRAKAFYNDLLGLREIPRPPSFDFPGAWYRIGPVDIHLVGGLPKADPHTSRHFCLWVGDVHAAGAEAEKLGLKPNWNHRKIPGVDRFYINDPDGNQLEFQGAEKI